MNELSDVFDRVADIHHKRVADKALCGEITVAHNIVAETSLTEMKRKNITDIAAVLEWDRVDVLTVKRLNRSYSTVIVDERS